MAAAAAAATAVALTRFDCVRRCGHHDHGSGGSFDCGYGGVRRRNHCSGASFDCGFGDVCRRGHGSGCSSVFGEVYGSGCSFDCGFEGGRRCGHGCGCEATSIQLLPVIQARHHRCASRPPRLGFRNRNSRIGNQCYQSQSLLPHPQLRPRRLHPCRLDTRLNPRHQDNVVFARTIHAG